MLLELAQWLAKTQHIRGFYVFDYITLRLSLIHI